ncbi:AraC-type DNA-binding protein [Chitinophaga sp. CF118]|uniref:helix-turn-helix domain-containing protein n=1 Tax=Chitinophaga sp. CF118 TaxID=1884367 RepID=UPI0008E2053D|nr:AraC family transcriptional regulator [Chitinophaga sp. CF118]SFD20670.1 AraC-type DNA-binding protein [Chitinophaga sp. CF118]
MLTPTPNSPEKLFYIEREEPGYIPVAAIPEEYLQLILPYAGVYFDRDEHCDILSQHIQVGPFSFWIQETYANADIILCPFTPRPTWALHFMYETSVNVKLYENTSFSLEEKECNLFNLVSDLHKVPMEDGQKLTSCHINILPEALGKLAVKYPALRRLASKKPANVTGPINTHPYFINSVCDFLIQKILTCRHIEIPAHHFLYRCCLDLFMNFAYQDAHSTQRYFISDVLNASSFRRLFDYLTDHPHINNTLEELGEMFQLDIITLQKGFLKDFGMPIKAFINMTKMMTVFEMLTVKATTLSHIATIVGFKSWEKLDQAFMAFYGCDMETLRRAM